MTTLEEFGEHKFPDAGLVSSSKGRRWQGIAAELRAHSAGEIPAICPDQMEITLAVEGVREGSVERRGNGRFQSTRVQSGTLWFCPIGVQEDSIRISKDLPRILHVYLPKTQFVELSKHTSRSFTPGDVPYLADVEDEFIRQISLRILKELEQETAFGPILAEQLSLALILHLAMAYTGLRASEETRSERGRLDGRRLARVTDYIEANLRNELTIADLAGVACLSPYHFARAFREATGLPPHRYIVARRLQNGRRLLAGREHSLADVAYECSFSSQAAFARAFRKYFGLTPKQFRSHREQ